MTLTFCALITALLASCTRRSFEPNPLINAPSPAWDAYKSEEETERRIAGWTWEDKHGCKRSYSDLRQILDQHRLWLRTKGKEGAQADFYSTKLDGASFIEEDLRKANFTSAKLNDVNFLHADLSDASLDYVDFGNHERRVPHTGFGGARLRHASMTGAKLVAVDLTLADLTDVDLSDANLGGASLRGAFIIRTILRRVVLSNVDMWTTRFSSPIYEPVANPSVREMAGAYGLASLSYDNDPAALTDMQHEFKEHGYREQERELTYAIKKRAQDRTRAACTFRPSVWAACGNYIFAKTFFDLPSRYGMQPNRSLFLIVVFGGIFATIYLIAMHTKTLGAVYVVGAREIGGKQRKQGLRIARRKRTNDTLWLLVKRELQLARTAVTLSLLTATSLGFHDISLGQWIRMLSRRDYELRTCGWLRTLSGLQSLISFLLLATWVLTYFSRPFE